MTIDRNGLTVSRCTALTKVGLHVHTSRRATRLERAAISHGRDASSIIKRIFSEAQCKGMGFVTITERNSLAPSLVLKHSWPDKTFTGVEVTTLFPEDGGRVHLLAYGLQEPEFEEIRRIRRDIHELRDYIKERHIAYSVAHAVHSVEIKDLNVEHLEKLLLLFDVFEIVNGGCSYGSNLIWANLLRSLTPDCIERLMKKHPIRPISEDPWIKGFTAGSDDHLDGVIGDTYTVAPAGSVGEFLDYLRSKLTFVGEYRNPIGGWGGHPRRRGPDVQRTHDLTGSRLWADMFESLDPRTEAA
ncbi:MAG TPA: hypothetical protein DCR97_09840 [Deltaproteobacteria bacterium]|nr:hypothetical protein [Deltaproteobacteria bacterium]